MGIVCSQDFSHEKSGLVSPEKKKQKCFEMSAAVVTGIFKFKILPAVI